MLLWSLMHQRHPRDVDEYEAGSSLDDLHPATSLLPDRAAFADLIRSCLQLQPASRPLMADVAADALRLAASVNALGSAAANAVFICPAAAPEEEAEGGRASESVELTYYWSDLPPEEGRAK
mmetsp:Transcript_3976/g.13090  ORF Transcript_3976/g.13090 Transcript_3976/m.13090 type:complete len:122 (+) Transcript_3976:1-366(+)